MKGGIVLFCFILSLPMVNWGSSINTPSQQQIDFEIALDGYIQERVDYCFSIAAENDETMPEAFDKWLRTCGQKGHLNEDLGIFSLPMWNDSDFYLNYVHPVNEIVSSCVEYRKWKGKMLDEFLTQILPLMQKKSLFLTGTNAGRFILEPLSIINDNVCVISINALSDSTYIEYVNRVYAGKIALPTKVDLVATAKLSEFKKIYKDVGSDIKFVRKMNDYLMRDIFDKNIGTHRIFYDEDYISGWVYDHATPTLYMLELREKIQKPKRKKIEENIKYWRNLLENSGGIPIETKPALAKIRSAFGGFCVSHSFYEEAEEAFNQAIQLFPESPEGYFRLCTEVLLPNNRFDEINKVISRMPTSKDDLFVRRIRDLSLIKKKDLNKVKVEREKEHFE